MAVQTFGLAKLLDLATTREHRPRARRAHVADEYSELAGVVGDTHSIDGELRRHLLLGHVVVRNGITVTPKQAQVR